MYNLDSLREKKDAIVFAIMQILRDEEAKTNLHEVEQLYDIYFYLTSLQEKEEEQKEKNVSPEAETFLKGIIKSN